MTYEPSGEESLALRTLVAFRRADRVVRMREGEAVRARGLTPAQFGVLETLYHDGPLRVGEVMERMLATPGNMTVVVRNMARDGYIVRKADPSDGRSCLLDLTEKGTKAFEEVWPEHLALVAEIFSVLDDTDKKDLIRILGRFEAEEAR